MRLIYPGKAVSKVSPLGPGDVTEIIENIYWSLASGTKLLKAL